MGKLSLGQQKGCPRLFNRGSHSIEVDLILATKWRVAAEWRFNFIMLEEVVWCLTAYPCENLDEDPFIPQ